MTEITGSKMHSRHIQSEPTNIWSFNNPTKMDRAMLIVTDDNGDKLTPHATNITRHRITLTFLDRESGSAIITDCMDDYNE